MVKVREDRSSISVDSTLVDALHYGRQQALEVLVLKLGQEIDECQNARDRLNLVRAFLASVSELERMVAQTLRRTQAEARLATSVEMVALSPVDDLLERRRLRHESMQPATG